MTSDRENYDSKAMSDAQDTATEFLDTLVEQYLEDGECSDDLLNDFGNGDSYHHESHVDRDYDLLEAAELLDQLHNHVETDSGLWEGQEPKEAIATQAAFTYGAAVYSYWRDLIKEINEKDALEQLKTVWDAMENVDSFYEDSVGTQIAEGFKVMQNQCKDLIQKTIEAIIKQFWKAQDS